MICVTYGELYRRNKGSTHGLKQEDFSYLQQWWDHGKKEMQQLCRQYTLNVSKDISQSMRTPEIEIVDLHNLVEFTGNRGFIELLKAKRRELDNLLGIRAQGAFQSAVEMNGPTNIFFGLEKKNVKEDLYILYTNWTAHCGA